MYRVLIAEDEPRIAAFIDKGLRKQGFKTAIVSDGNAIVPTLKKDSFDLLLLDIGLPGKSGWLVLEELRQVLLHLPVIIVTARNGESTRTESLRRGANGYIAKPFQFSDLLDLVNRLLLAAQDG